eukprot:gene17311-19044_t
MAEPPCFVDVLMAFHGSASLIHSYSHIPETEFGYYNTLSNYNTTFRDFNKKQRYFYLLGLSNPSLEIYRKGLNPKQTMKPLEPMADGTMAPTGKIKDENNVAFIYGILEINPLTTQMTLQQLQKMAEKQRQQIRRNNQDLITKQQRLKEMKAGLKKAPQGTQAGSSAKPNQSDGYASKLRETYQNHLGRLREMRLVQDEVDSQKFDNVELAHELERVREIFSSKQKELVSAAAKVDNLTKQLEDRRNGLSHARATPEKLNRRRKIRAARDELDRLRKELTVRNEVNNEQEIKLALQQSTLRDKQKELLELNKKIDLVGHQLKPNTIPSDYDSDTSNSSDIVLNSGSDLNGNKKFTSGFMFDTLQKKKAQDRILNMDRSQSLPAVNGVGKMQPNQVPYVRRGKFYVAPDGREFDRPPTVDDYPEFAGSSFQASRNSLVLPVGASSLNPSSSSESLPLGRNPSLSSPHLPRSRTDVLPFLQENHSNGSFLGPPRLGSGIAPYGPNASPNGMRKTGRFNSQSPSSSVSSLSSITSASEFEKAEKDRSPTDPIGNGRRPGDAEIWMKSSDFRTSSPVSTERMSSAVFSDCKLTSCSDVLSGIATRYQDCAKSDAIEVLKFQADVHSHDLMPVSEFNAPVTTENDSVDEEPVLSPPPLPEKKSKPPKLPPKPSIAPKPKSKPLPQPPAPQNQESEFSEEKEEMDLVKNVSHSRQPNFTELNDDLNKISVHDLVEQFKDAIPSVKQPIMKQIGKDHYPQREEDQGKPGEMEQDSNDNDIIMNGDADDSSDMMNGVDFNDSYEMTFADIDMISATQNDLLPYLQNMVNEQQQLVDQSDDDSLSQASENERPILPVVISVPLDKMPPTILKKPGRDNKKRGRIQLDPHALLLDAALEGEMSLVKEIVYKVPDPSFSNAEGITALHNAVCGNHKDVVRYLVEIGCDINSPDNNGWTPLHCAAFYNDVELCRFLVEHGASVYAMTYSDRQTAAEKCSRLEENYDECFGFLHDCKESVGRKHSGEVCSVYDYTAEREDELSFHCGEQLRILRRGDGNEKEWWWAENRRRETGYVPYNLLGIHPRIAGEV